MKRIVGMLMAVCICFGLCTQANVSEAARGVHSVDYFKGDGTIEDPEWHCFSEYNKDEDNLLTTYTNTIDVNSISYVNGVYGAWIGETIAHEYLEVDSLIRREFRKDSNGNLWTRIRWETSSGNPQFEPYEPTSWEMVVIGSHIKDEYKEREMLICLKAYIAILAECKK